MQSRKERKQAGENFGETGQKFRPIVVPCRKPNSELNSEMGPGLQSCVRLRVGPVGFFHSYNWIMRSVGVRFVGGPADSMEFIIPGDPMDPPVKYDLLHASLAGGSCRVTYWREVNPEDEGPLWLYRCTGD